MASEIGPCGDDDGVADDEIQKIKQMAYELVCGRYDQDHGGESCGNAVAAVIIPDRSVDRVESTLRGFGRGRPEACLD